MKTQPSAEPVEVADAATPPPAQLPVEAPPATPAPAPKICCKCELPAVFKIDGDLFCDKHHTAAMNELRDKLMGRTPAAI